MASLSTARTRLGLYGYVMRPAGSFIRAAQALAQLAKVTALDLAVTGITIADLVVTRVTVEDKVVVSVAQTDSVVIRVTVDDKAVTGATIAEWPTV